MLVEALNSILNQTVAVDEIIIVDDGSTDNTKELIAKTNAPFRYIYQENQGVAVARNVAVKAATSKWIAFLDSDDIWLPTKIEEQLLALRDQPRQHIIYTGETWERNGQVVVQRKFQAKLSGEIFQQALKRCFVGVSTLMIKKSIWTRNKGMDPAFLVAEDYDLWLRLSAKYPFLLVDKPLVLKRDGHPNQLSHQWGIDCYRVMALEKQLDNLALDFKQRDAVIKELLKKCEYLIKGFLKHGKELEAGKYQTLLKKVQNLPLVDIRDVPRDMGVYLMKDCDDSILYVGKANNLRSRVQSYFRSKGDGRPKVKIMQKKIKKVDYITTESENKALILEDKLIKEHQPRYNSMLKDGKSYPSIQVTIHEDFPRILKVHYCEKDGSIFFGPFAVGISVKDVVKKLQDKYKFRHCSGPNFAPNAPCLYAQLDMCSQPCTGKISHDEYLRRIQKAIEYLKRIEEMEVEE